MVALFSFGLKQPPVNVYLTFDDGPGPGSPQVYRLADSLKVKINLFVIGSRALREDSIYQIFQYHRNDTFLLFGNHSYSHAGGHYKRYYSDPGSVLEDFDRNRDALGLDNHIARLPGRNYWRLGWRIADDIANGKETADSLAARGYQVFGWDMEWRRDSLHNNTCLEMIGRLDKMVLNGWTFRPGYIVILFHDEEFEDAAFRTEVFKFINLVRNEKHYRIAHLTDYPVSLAN